MCFTVCMRYSASHGGFYFSRGKYSAAHIMWYKSHLREMGSLWRRFAKPTRLEADQRRWSAHRFEKVMLL